MGSSRTPNGLTRPLDRLVHLNGFYREEPRIVERTVGTAAKVAVAGAGTYAVGSYIRGRQPGLNPLAATRAGHQANVATGRKIGAWFKPRIAGAATAGAGVLDTASAAARKAASALRNIRR